MKQTNTNSRGFAQARFYLWALIVFGFSCATPASSLAQIRRIEVIDRGGGLVAPLDAAVLARAFARVPPEEEVEDNRELAAGGATLKTDPDLEILLEKADRRREDGNYRAATRMWQAVLERSGDALFSQDEVHYLSLVNRVERIIAVLPEDGLAIYRITADAEAKEILASAGDPNDLTALNQVVRRFFISSLGDDAAFRLGCIYLDEYDFAGALRMFNKIIEYYPDPSVPLSEVHTRIALCHSFMGDSDAATNSIGIAKDLAGDDIGGAALSVEDSIGKISINSSGNEVLSDWSMSMGNVKRLSAMASLPKAAYSSDQEAAWQFFVPPRDSRYSSSADTIGSVLIGKEATTKKNRNTRNMVEKNLIEAWEKNNWRPAGHLLFDRDRVFFKTPADITAWDRNKIDKYLDGNSEIDENVAGIDQFNSWRSVWRNAFEIDESTMMIQTIRKSWGAFNRRRQGGASNFPYPTTFPEVQLYGDTVFQQMSFHDGVLYSIEGKPFDDRNRHAPRRITPQWNASVRRTRTNFLTAYDQASGKMLWSIPDFKAKTGKTDADEPTGESDAEEQLQGGGFMGAPIGYAKMVLAPVNLGGAIHIYALDPKDGKTIWTSFLCDEPESGSVPWAPINMSIDGSDLFVNCGMGVIFVIDPSSGMVRFAKRYKREGEKDNFGRRNGWTTERLLFDGWSSDLILPYGSQLICFCTDTKTIRAFDRSTGDLLWWSSMKPDGHPVDYIIGAYNDILYLGGTSTVIAIDLKGEGMLAWGSDDLFDGKKSRGRGMVTPEGVFMPVENAVYRLSLTDIGRDKQILDRFEVFLGTEAPVGNLYSDGKRIWVHGANRVYALRPKK